MTVRFKLGDFAPRALRKPCWRKQDHPSKGAAEAQARSLRRRVLDGGGVHVYACPYHDSETWHVGHPPGTSKEWRR